MIRASELKHDCKRLNFAICLAGTEDHHERAWMIFEMGTICGKADHLWHLTDHPWHPYLVQGTIYMARKIATYGLGDQFCRTIGGMAGSMGCHCIAFIFLSESWQIYSDTQSYRPTPYESLVSLMVQNLCQILISCAIILHGW